MIILLTKTTAAQNEVALSYHRVRGLYFMAVVFAATIVPLVFLKTCVCKLVIAVILALLYSKIQIIKCSLGINLISILSLLYFVLFNIQMDETVFTGENL